MELAGYLMTLCAFCAVVLVLESVVENGALKGAARFSMALLVIAVFLSPLEKLF